MAEVLCMQAVIVLLGKDIAGSHWPVCRCSACSPQYEKPNGMSVAAAYESSIPSSCSFSYTRTIFSSTNFLI